MAARRIVEAPNRHPDTDAWNSQMRVWWTFLQTNIVHYETNASIVNVTIPVGPPAADIRAIEVPAQDYHVEVWSKIDPAPHGKHMLTFGMNSETNTSPLMTPPNPPATIFVLHGYMLSKESMMPWAYLLAQNGYRVILVDLRGHGLSTGDTVSYGKYEAADLSQVLDYLQARGLCDKSLGVLGYSYGATLALHWAAHDDRVRAVVAIAPYNHPDDAFVRLAHDLKIPITRSAAQKAVELAGTRLNINWADWSGEAAIRQVRAPVLLIGGGKDTISLPEDIVALHNASAGKSIIIQIPVANHEVLPYLFHALAEPVEAWFRVGLDSTRFPEALGEEKAAALAK